MRFCQRLPSRNRPGILFTTLVVEPGSLQTKPPAISWRPCNFRGMRLPIAANDNGPLGRIYTFDEAATELHVGKRSLQDIVKRHPHYAKNGRVYLFCDNDIRLIWEGIHCHSSSQSEKVPTTGRSVAPSVNSLYSKARALTTRKQPKKSVSSVRLAS